MIRGRVVVACRPGEAGPVSAALAALGANATEIRDQSGSRSIVHARFGGEPDALAAARALRADGLPAVGGPQTAGHESAWRKHTAPTWFGDRACVCPPWSEFDRSAADLVVEIDPIGGFGSGSHPTTVLALEQMAALLGPGDSLLDVGCGSGVLAVAGAGMGAGSVLAIDVDSKAITATGLNAALNGVDGRVEVRCEPLASIEPAFDLVVANIHAPVLASLATDLVRVVAPGGHLVLSGLSRAQTSVVVAAMRPLEQIARAERDDWVALTLGFCEPKRSP